MFDAKVYLHVIAPTWVGSLTTLLNSNRKQTTVYNDHNVKTLPMWLTMLYDSKAYTDEYHVVIPFSNAACGVINQLTAEGVSFNFIDVADSMSYYNLSSLNIDSTPGIINTVKISGIVLSNSMLTNLMLDCISTGAPLFVDNKKSSVSSSVRDKLISSMSVTTTEDDVADGISVRYYEESFLETENILLVLRISPDKQLKCNQTYDEFFTEKLVSSDNINQLRNRVASHTGLDVKLIAFYDRKFKQLVGQKRLQSVEKI